MKPCTQLARRHANSGKQSWSIFAAPLLSSCLRLAGTALAQERPGSRRRRPAGPPANKAARAGPSASSQAGPGIFSLLPGDAVSEHSVDLAGGGKLDYTVTAGTFSLFDQSGERSAAVFYTAYIVKTADRGPPAGDVRVQRRAGRGVGVSQSRPGRSAARRIRHGRTRRRQRPPGRQSGHLARLHRSGADRSGRHRLEQAGQTRRRQRVLGRARRRRVRWRKWSRSMSPRTAASASPKFILGESYGGFRAAKVARALQSEQGI